MREHNQIFYAIVNLLCCPYGCLDVIVSNVMRDFFKTEKCFFSPADNHLACKDRAMRAFTSSWSISWPLSAC